MVWYYSKIKFTRVGLKVVKKQQGGGCNAVDHMGTNRALTDNLGARAAVLNNPIHFSFATSSCGGESVAYILALFLKALHPQVFRDFKFLHLKSCFFFKKKNLCMFCYLFVFSVKLFLALYVRGRAAGK